MNAQGYHVAHVLISAPSYMADRREGHEKVLHPLRKVRVILTNGAMYSRVFECTGLTEDFVSNNYEAEKEHWTKLDPNKKENQDANPIP